MSILFKGKEAVGLCSDLIDLNHNVKLCGHSHSFGKQALGSMLRLVFKQSFYLTLHWAECLYPIAQACLYSVLNWVHPHIIFALEGR